MIHPVWEIIPEHHGEVFLKEGAGPPGLESSKDRAGSQDKDCHCLRRTASEELLMLVFFFKQRKTFLLVFSSL